MFHRPGTLETEFKNLGEKLDAILAKAKQGVAEAGDEASLRVADLKAKRQTVRERLDELRESGDEKWDILKDGIQSAWKDLETALKEMSS